MHHDEFYMARAFELARLGRAEIAQDAPFGPLALRRAVVGSM